MDESYGEWWLPDDHEVRKPGRLTWGLQSPQLSLLDPPSGVWPTGGSLTMGEESISMLHGKMAHHGGVTLLGGTWGGIQFSHGVTTHTFRFDKALFGVWLDAPGEAFFRTLEVELPALGPVLGPRPIEPSPWPTDRSKYLRLALDRRTQSWRDGQFEVTLEYRWATRFGEASASIDMVPTVVLTSSRPEPLDDWLTRWVYPIGELVSVLTGAQARPLRIFGWSKKHMSPSERRTRRLPIWVRGVGDHDDEYKSPPIATAATLNNNPLGLPGVLGQFRSLAAKQAVFIGLLGDTIIHPDRPIRNRYLDLMAGVEAYDTQANGIGPIKADHFKSTRATILGQVKAAGTLSPADTKFLKRWLLTRSSFSLENRLTRLGKRTGQNSSWSVKANRMAGLRNDIAHGNASVDPAELHDAYEQAYSLARQLVLEDLRIA